jgi:uncharacterized protein (DUF924 family)
MFDTDPRNQHAEPPWVGEVIRFWFEELTEAHWFKKSDAIDTLINDRFLTLHRHLAAQGRVEAATPRHLLAMIIVLDQFSRNLFRNDARAFAADPIARRLGGWAIEHNAVTAMKVEERYFLYLPFEHSEDREDQALSVDLISRLGREEWTQYALAHKLIIDRFGRFPHRNAALHRASTAEEVAFLKEPMGSF